MAGSTRCGKYFVAYKGRDISRSEIVECLESKNRSSDFDVKVVDEGNVIFAKTVLSSYHNDRDPYRDNENNMFVSGYSQEEMGRSIRRFSYEIGDEDRYHTLVSYLYNDFSLELFKKLEGIHFCTAIWNGSELIAGVTSPSTQYNHLYYPYNP